MIRAITVMQIRGSYGEITVSLQERCYPWQLSNEHGSQHFMRSSSHHVCHQASHDVWVTRNTRRDISRGSRGTRLISWTLATVLLLLLLLLLGHGMSVPHGDIILVPTVGCIGVTVRVAARGSCACSCSGVLLRLSGWLLGIWLGL
jgi:hypothetical protein